MRTTGKGKNGMNPIIDKIRKLQALANGATTEAEAALAASRVQELLAKHNLDLGLVALNEDPGIRQTTEREWRRAPEYISILASTCDVLFDVLHYRQGSKFGRAYVFVGLKANVEAACLTFEYLIDSVESLARGAKQNKAVYGADQFLAFKIGAADSIKQIARLQKTQTIADNPGYSELVHIGNTTSRRLYDDTKFSGPPLQIGNNWGSSRFNAGYQEGYEQGSRVDLHGARTNRMLK
jgi:hypothetical protein